MKYWFDTEFIEDGKTIDLISIGIKAEPYQLRIIFIGFVVVFWSIVISFILWSM